MARELATETINTTVKLIERTARVTIFTTYQQEPLVKLERETLMYDVISGDRGLTKKYPNDPSDHRVIDLFSGGNWLVEYGYMSTIGGMHTITSCHEINYTVNGSVLGYSGTGAGLTVTFYDSNKEIIFTTTTIAGGIFTAVWYDNVNPIYCEVYDAGLGRGARSVAQIATGTFTLNLSTGGKKSFVWGG